MNIDRIISEQINRFINESVFGEDDNKQNPNDKFAIERAKEKEEYINKNGKESDENNFSAAYSFLTNPTTNLSAVADKLVDAGVLNCKKGESAQSYLRKMAKELDAPNGGNYELHKNMISAILKIKGQVAAS